MSTPANLYRALYVAALAMAIVTGVIFGFKGNSHTPPMPFGVELIALPIGLVGFLYDIIKHKSLKVHYWGLGVNGAVMILMMIPALV
ncbi:hypothetical protein [Mucilaginibacter sp. AK015]|uniref:hypothetical protein n=1 Tax=Mucilaginibacter sp. AK015 TaxID=2723072 RepID=UPI001611EA53|nr:hypothetical protein [Mucilaginibacter sp. AK015]MBB5394632.1 hypothetical protein [Mucilaginibacter sp. AK015]